MPVFEDERGTYFFNSRDLALFPFVPSLVDLGVTALKLEGRMKSIHYIAQVVSLYRRLLDGDSVSEEETLRLLSRVNNRGYSQGFMKGEVDHKDYKFEKSAPASTAVFLGNIEASDGTEGAVMEIRNKIFAGDLVEILKTDGTVLEMTLPDPLMDIKGELRTQASHGTRVRLPMSLPPYSIVRRIR